MLLWSSLTVVTQHFMLAWSQNWNSSRVAGTSAGGGKSPPGKKSTSTLQQQNECQQGLWCWWMFTLIQLSGSLSVQRNKKKSTSIYFPHKSTISFPNHAHLRTLDAIAYPNMTDYYKLICIDFSNSPSTAEVKVSPCITYCEVHSFS